MFELINSIFINLDISVSMKLNRGQKNSLKLKSLESRFIKKNEKHIYTPG